MYIISFCQISGKYCNDIWRLVSLLEACFLINNMFAKFNLRDDSHSSYLSFLS